ncbi:S-layer family protein [Bradyrhizobium sp.]|uniref:beta strand repeat-containing protein n=1 Tax=Bradyrhizobium sp. TaxID=376 RepID=UPI00273361FC|nr:MBG domain-containing protein [Bradyrhizobium sp.]MDP3077503.1 MBG domain-containing protein [Bradyrhizobium sp.]
MMMARFRNTLLATTVLMPLGGLAATANPLGSQVVGGTANVQGQGTSTVTVTQSTDRAIINWNTFNIGSGETTRFVQPGSSSVTLNRVTGGLGASVLDGTLTANGRIFLVNPDGILFGAGSRVNTGSFLATTNDIRNADFMAGRYQFNTPGRPEASIVNLGTITAQNGGFAALVAPGVRNTGTITANLGTVGLAAGNNFSLDFYGDRLITLGVNDSIAARVIDVATGRPLNALVRNDGKLKADGGRVELTAAAARLVVDSVINNSGVIEANSIGSRNGMIVLGAATRATKPMGAPKQTVRLSGSLSAAGRSGGTQGGTIVVTGENIELAAATIDASGQTGGGRVLIGGDVGGGRGNAAVANASASALESFGVPTASTVGVDAATTIDVSAKATGNGGKVVVWSDQATTFYGTIRAQGGPESGNGGFVEVSGHQSLTFNGLVDTGAPRGTNGTLLLDPQDTLITTVAGPGVVTVSSIQNALANGDVVVTTGSGGSEPGNITVASNINWTTTNALTLSAHRDIVVDASISNSGGAAVNLRADNTGTGFGTVSFGGAGSISTSGAVSIYYNPSVNPVGSTVNTASYLNPTENFSGNVTSGQLLAYMLVNSVSDLQNVQNNLNGRYALGNDIDAGQTATWNGGLGFLPIGYSSASTTNSAVPTYSPLIGINATPARFLGVFDGMGYSISGLTINNPGAFNLGLFSWIGAGAIVRNVTVVGSLTGGSEYQNFGLLAGWNLGAISNSNVSGIVSVGDSSFNIGGLVGWNWGGTITNSYAAANVTAGNSAGGIGGLAGLQGYYLSAGGTIRDSYATGVVQAGDNSSGIGGLIGDNNSAIIRNSYATGNVIAGNNAQAIGGFAGQSNGYWATNLITASYATGNVFGGTGSRYVGGLVGFNLWGAVLSNSYATGNVTGGTAVGGLVGWNGYNGQPVGATINASYSTGFVSGASLVGGLVGFNNGGTTTNSYWDTQTSGQPTSIAGGTAMTTTQLKSGLPVGFDPSVWGSSAAVNSSYPHLLWQAANPPPAPNPTVLRPGLIPITIAIDPEQKIYGNADPVLTYHVTSGGLSAGDTFGGSLTRVAGEDVGTYSISPGTLTLPANYSVTFLSSTLIIQPRPITVTANAQSRPVGAANPALTYAVGGLGLVGSHTLSGSLATNATTSSPAGTYQITQGTLANSNYAVTYVGANLTIVPPQTTDPTAGLLSTFAQLTNQAAGLKIVLPATTVASEQSSIFPVVSDEDIRVEGRKLLDALFAQANTNYSILDAYQLFVDVLTLVGSFDSKYHNEENNQKTFLFRGKLITGSDLNYYYEGLFFSTYGWPKWTLYRSMEAWKLGKYHQLPSSNAYWAADQGYTDGAVYQFLN